MNEKYTHEIEEKLKSERFEALHQFEDWLELPVTILGLIWLILLVIELIWGLNPFLEMLGYVIWIILIIDFSIRFILAPEKTAYLKKNWLTALSLVLPALRILNFIRFIRILRLARTVRGLRLLKIIGSLNRGMRSVRNSFAKRGFSYIVILTVIVTFVGAAGMLAFENNTQDNTGFRNFGDALWWTAMIMTTLGSAAWPQTPEGRILAFLLSLYAFGIFGYITAALASYFIGRDTENKNSDLSKDNSMSKLKEEINELKNEIRKLSENK